MVYIDEHIPEHYIHIDGRDYYIYKNGSVLDDNIVPICTSGGIDCLYVENEYEPLVYELYDEKYIIKLRLFQNGYVDTDDEKYTTICTTGGKECADKYINDNYPEDVVLKGDTYKLYLDGHSTDSKGNVICTEGGRPCLEQWVLDNIPTEVYYTIDGKDTTFEIIEGSGKVTDEDGNVICETGGQDCLDDHIAEITSEIYDIITGDMRYQIQVYTDGRVLAVRNGEVLCSTGGVDCMNEWITVNVPQVFIHIDGREYYIYQNGTVLDDDFNLICSSGG